MMSWPRLTKEHISVNEAEEERTAIRVSESSHTDAGKVYSLSVNPFQEDARMHSYGNNILLLNGPSL